MTYPENTDSLKVIPGFCIILTTVCPQLCTDSSTVPSADIQDLRAGEKESIITSDRGKGECQKAFHEQHTTPTTAPVLAYSNYSKPFIVETDTSDKELGAVLS